MTSSIEQDFSLQPEQDKQALPIRYTRTYHPDEAKYTMLRLNSSDIDSATIVKTDAQIQEEVRGKKENENWFTSEYWREKGTPKEQIEFNINGSPITIYNWNSEKPFTEEHAIEAKEVLEQLAARFPQLLPHLRYVLIDDIQMPSALGDEEKLPTNGHAIKEQSTFVLLPRGMELGLPHRVAKVSNFKGTMTHELTHLFDEEFEQEWDENFTWEMCWNKPEDWERKVLLLKDGRRTMFINKHTGELAPFFQFPLQREQCINYYAAMHPQEDVPESNVAYIWDPQLLQKTSDTKMKIFEKHDATKQPGYNQQKASATYHRIPDAEIKLPEIKPETVPYYITEPELMGID